MIDLGVITPGSTIRIPFSTFNTAGASVTMTNFAAADILIYKDGNTTERASTSGFTATTDFSSKTGKQLIVIDLADNTTADFYAAGSEYLVAVNSVTVDSQTTGLWVARFTIGYREAILNTTIATLSSQTSFTLAAGPADDSALVGCIAVIHDVASAVQRAIGVVSAYTGSSKTVTLAADPGIFTMAAKDNISFFVPSNTRFLAGIATGPTNLNTIFNTDYATVYDTSAKAFLSKLADGVSHGGTLGSSTATLALSRLNITSQTSNTVGLTIAGNGTGAGSTITGGGTGKGLSIVGGGTSGDGLTVTTTSGHAMTLTATGASKHGLQITGGDSGTSDGLKLVAGTGGVGFRLDTLTTSGAVTFGSTFGITGAVTLSSTLAVGATTLNALTVTNATTLAGAFTATNASNDVRGIALHATQAAYAPSTATALATAQTAIDAIGAKTTNLPNDPADASDIAASFVTVNSTLSTIAGYIDTEIGTLLSRLGTPSDLGSGATVAANLADIEAQSYTPNTPSALNKSASSSVIITGPQTNTYEDTFVRDGTYHSVDDSAGTTDFYYEFDLTGIANAVGVGVNWSGYLAGAANSIKVYAYYWTEAEWQQIGTIAGTAGTTPSEQAMELTGNYTLDGLVRIKFSNTGLTSSSLKTDRILLGYAVVPPSTSDILTALGTVGNLDTQLSDLQTHGDSTWSTATGFAEPGDEMNLADGAISSDTFTIAVYAGVASGHLERQDQVWRRFFKRVTKDDEEIKTYQDDGTTVQTTQAYTSSGSDDDVGGAT